jgi:hypothetical protein
MYCILSNARTLPYEEAGTLTAPFWRALNPVTRPRSVATLVDRGYRCHGLPMSEFSKAGGPCKCLTMFLPQREAVE